MRHLEKVNKELLLVFSMFVIALALNFVIDAQRMVLYVYTLPTVASAYIYGRRHATLTAFASVLLVTLLTMTSGVFGKEASAAPTTTWLDLVAWGGSLIVTGYLMGTLYEHKNAQLQELRSTYHGVLLIMRHLVSKDEYTEHHSHRVSEYAARIAAHLKLSPERIEDVRAASLLHDIGKLEISRELLYKAARLTSDEYQEIQQHVGRGVEMLETVGGSLRRVIPIVLAHHDKFDGSGYHPTRRTFRSSARHLSRGRLRLADQRSAVSQGHVSVRSQGHHRQGHGDRLRSAGGRSLPRGVPVRRDGREAGGRMIATPSASETAGALTAAERRRFVRIACPPDASARLRAGTSARLLDVGLGGALVESSTRLTPGSVNATLFVSPDIAFRARAHIVRAFVVGVTRDENGATSLIYRAGLEFGPMSADEAGTLSTFVTGALREGSQALTEPVERNVTIRFPQGWTISRKRDTVIARAPEGSRFMFLGAPQCQPHGDLAEMARSSMLEAGFSALHGQATTLNGQEAFVGFYNGRLRNLGVVVVEAAHVRVDGYTYLVAGVAPWSAYESVRHEFFATISSFGSPAGVDGVQLVSAPSPHSLDEFDEAASSAVA
jgi:putative nucleotidyltransferase with HDIG domain